MPISDKRTLTLDRLNSIIEEAGAEDPGTDFPSHDQLDLYQQLDEGAARRLAKLRGDLYLDGLIELSGETARILSTHRGELFLRNLRKLSLAAYESLGKYRGTRLVIRVTSLSEEASEALSRYKGDELVLCDLKKLSVAAARKLSNCKCSLTLWGLASLSTPAAAALSRHRGSDCDSILCFSSLTYLSGPAATWLAQYKNRLSLPELERLGDGAADALSKMNQENFWNISKTIEIELYRCRAIGEARYPAIEGLRQKGVAQLQSVFEGWGDDGIFCHYLSRAGKQFSKVQDSDGFDLEDKLSLEVEELLREQGMGDEDGTIVNGNSWGMVGLFLLNLKTGRATWMSGSGYEAGRIAELMAFCEFEDLKEVRGSFDLEQIYIEFDDEVGDIFSMNSPSLTSLTCLPGTSRETLKRLESLIQVGFCAMREVHGQCCDDNWLEMFWSNFSEFSTDRKKPCKELAGGGVIGRITGMNFTVYVADRSITYSKGTKRLTMKIPKDTLETKRFKFVFECKFPKRKATGEGKGE